MTGRWRWGIPPAVPEHTPCAVHRALKADAWARAERYLVSGYPVLGGALGPYAPVSIAAPGAAARAPPPTPPWCWLSACHPCRASRSRCAGCPHRCAAGRAPTATPTVRATPSSPPACLVGGAAVGWDGLPRA